MPENLSQTGEKKLLQLIKKYLKNDSEVIRIFSEDCAVIDSGSRFYTLYTVDVLVEGTHFRRDYMPGYLVGRKALKVNLNDIAAMGGIPQYFLVSLGAPPNTSLKLIEDIYEGLDATAKEFNVKLIGGNLSSAPQLFVDITMVGRVEKKYILQRNGAKRGDLIFVSGRLGNPAEGLNLLREGFRLIGNGLILPEGQRDTHLVMEAIQSHLDPPCSVEIGQKLAKTLMVTSMIDLSDGVASDLEEICRESHLGARINLENVPVAPSVLYWERKRNRDPKILALLGGEDYHLLFTVSRKHRTEFLNQMNKQKIPVYEIGKMMPKSDGIEALDSAGNNLPLIGGFQHFR
jgi:thiamine-monophosphate kinase